MRLQRALQSPRKGSWCRAAGAGQRLRRGDVQGGTHVRARMTESAALSSWGTQPVCLLGGGASGI